MTTRNFDALFAPKAVALIGASNRPGSVGHVLAHNLIAGGFDGPILPVNPHETAIGGSLCYPSVDKLPVVPDLAVIATPPATVPAIVAQLGALGCRAAVVVTAGFGEGGDGGDLRQAMLDAAKPHLMRIVGPNCLGLMVPGMGLNASFAHLAPVPGDIAFVTQSGAIATTVLDWAAGRGLGFSHIISLGDMSDVDFGDLLDHLALDPAVRSILLYVETVTSPRKFMSAARIAARIKPVIVVKAGRSQGGAKAAFSHTGALAGSDLVYDAAFRRAGMLRVRELRELFEAAETLAAGIEVRGDRLTIVTNGGGAGVMAVDALETAGGRLAALSDGARTALDAVLPKNWSRANPIDIIGDASGERYRKALEIVGGEAESQDAVLVMNCPTGVVDGAEVSGSVIETAHAGTTPVLACWLGEATAAANRARLRAGKVPAYETPDEAVRAFMQLVTYGRNQALLMETPPLAEAVPTDAADKARALIGLVRGDGRSVLTAPEARALLDAYAIPTLATEVAATPEDAARLAEAMAGPVALKILSPDISHKSDVGGVRLDLATPEAVRTAAETMLTDVRAAAPAARSTGFTVQAMAVRPRAQELILGVIDDRTFGPALLFGHGGTAVEVIGDRVMGLPPLNMVLAREMMERTRVIRLLKGYRDRPPRGPRRRRPDPGQTRPARRRPAGDRRTRHQPPAGRRDRGAGPGRAGDPAAGGRRAPPAGHPPLPLRPGEDDRDPGRPGLSDAADPPDRRVPVGADDGALQPRGPAPALPGAGDRTGRGSRRPPDPDRLRPRDGFRGLRAEFRSHGGPGPADRRSQQRERGVRGHGPLGP